MTEIVIKLMDEEYNNIKEALSTPDINGVTIVNAIQTIKNGRVLPKGHGDLIDRSKLECDSDWSDIISDF